jgi:hypothetical protein
VRTLVETDALTGERGGYRLVQPIQAIQVPASVQAALAARIDRLPPDDKRLLQEAAVIGKDVPLSLLLAVAMAGETDVRRGLGHLQAAEPLYEMRFFPDVEYAAGRWDRDERTTSDAETSDSVAIRSVSTDHVHRRWLTLRPDSRGCNRVR